MKYSFTYSDHRNKFRNEADRLLVDVWEFQDGSVVLSCPSPEAIEILNKFIKQNNFVLISEKEES